MRDKAFGVGIKRRPAVLAPLQGKTNIVRNDGFDALREKNLSGKVLYGFKFRNLTGPDNPGHNGIGFAFKRDADANLRLRSLTVFFAERKDGRRGNEGIGCQRTDTHVLHQSFESKDAHGKSSLTPCCKKGRRILHVDDATGGKGSQRLTHFQGKLHKAMR